MAAQSALVLAVQYCDAVLRLRWRCGGGWVYCMEKQLSASIEKQVQDELSRAVAKFPTWPTDPFHALAVLGEEFGELTKAVLQYTYEPNKNVTSNDIRTEAIQTAAMALRWAMSLPVYQYERCPQHSQGEDNLPDDYEV